MRLDRLAARDFRNFSRLKIDLRPRVNFFLGDNAQGKTNLLEAMYLLCRGQSFRPADASSFLLRTQGESGGNDEVTGRDTAQTGHVDRPRQARISGVFMKHSLDYLVEMSIEKSKKTAVINGKRAASSALTALFPVVLFSPESLAAIKEGPDQRRQLIDEILLSHNPKDGRILREYVRALRSRNRLLRNLCDRIGPRKETEDALESVNGIYLLLCTHLTAARLRALNDLAPFFRDAMQAISANGTPPALSAELAEGPDEISVDYFISGESALKWSESQIYDALLKRQAELKLQEISAGVSLVGPHKHDIKLLLAGNDSRFYCSQGQQRALILALKIAQIVYHHQVHQTYPVLLLDDVLSELDTKKRANLMKFLEGISAQILITSTDLTWSEHFGVDQNSIFTVSRGQVGVGES